MEENTIEKGRFEPGEERPFRALKRKAELLGVVFGLPKPDVSLTSVENMPEEFSLPKEMVSVFGEIWAQPDSDKIEYGTSGDIKKGKLVFSKIKRGKKEYFRVSRKDGLLEFVGLRRIGIHHHGEQDYVRFSLGISSNFL